MKRLDFNDVIAICLHKIGIKPKVTHFIDGCTRMYGYGKMDGNIGIWKYNLPIYYARKYYNINY